jgi:hypothetical protein
MLRLRTIAPTGTKVGYSLRRRSDGAPYTPASQRLRRIRLPSVTARRRSPRRPPRTSAGSPLTLPDATTSAWADGIYEVTFHDAKGVVIDGYLVEMISGDDTPKRDRPQVAPLPPGPSRRWSTAASRVPCCRPRRTPPAPRTGGPPPGRSGWRRIARPAPRGTTWRPTRGSSSSCPAARPSRRRSPSRRAPSRSTSKWSMKSGSKAHAFAVAIDGKPIATYSGPRLDFSGVMTPAFTLEAGDHVVSFAGATVLGPDACSAARPGPGGPRSPDPHRTRRGERRCRITTTRKTSRRIRGPRSPAGTSGPA